MPRIQIPECPTNQAPGSSADKDKVVVYLLGRDHDPDLDPLKVVDINGLPMNAGGSITLPSGAIVTLNPDNTAIYDPNGQFDGMKNGHTAIDTFTYQVSDPNGTQSLADAVITISSANDTPVAEDDFVATTINTSVEFPILSNESEVVFEELSVVLLNETPHGNVIVNDNGTITFQPNPGFLGTVTLHYLVEDPEGASSDASVTIDVTRGLSFDSHTNFSHSK